MHSLSRRLLILLSVPLALFFGVMMFVLDTDILTLLFAGHVRVLQCERFSPGARIASRELGRLTSCEPNGDEQGRMLGEALPIGLRLKRTEE